MSVSASQGPFATALRQCFEHLGIEALYQQQNQLPQKIRVMIRQPDQLIRFDDTRIFQETTVVEVLVEDIAKPDVGDKIIVGDETFTVQGTPARDTKRLTWKLNVHKT